MDIRMIYPERRFVSEETVIGWAVDDICNAAIQAGQFPDDEDGSKFAAFCATVARPSLDEAIEILADNGSCTFTREVR